MIKFENTEVVGWEAAIRGMRNPMNSWERSDSTFASTMWVHIKNGELENVVNTQSLGKNDHDLMMRLAKAGTEHAKYRRMIVVYVDITAPLYFFKEFDTYKVGTVANSCSTMHKIAEKEFTLEDFSCEHLILENDSTEEEWDAAFTEEANRVLFDKYCVQLDPIDGYVSCYPLNYLEWTIDILNRARRLFLKTKDKRYWWQMIQLLPSSYNQRRTVMLNYEILANIYRQRKGHKLDEWREGFIQWIESLPYSEIITGKTD